MKDVIVVRQQGAVAIVQLNAPPLNLLTQQLRARIGDVFEELSARTDVRAIVLHGGTTFCAGADLKEFEARFDPALAERHCRNGHRMVSAVAKCRQPTICALEGASLGGGFELALACDFRVAGEEAKVGLPETNRGVWPGTAGIFFLQELVGRSIAKRMVLTGEIVFSAEAHKRHLVDELTGNGAAFGVAMKMAQDFASRSALSMAIPKRLMDQEFLLRLAEFMEVERRAYIETYQTYDAREGVCAFFEKRQPEWQHR